MKPNKISKFKQTSRWIVPTVIVGLLLVAAVFYKVSHHITPHKPVSASSDTKGEPTGSPATTSTNSGSSTQPGDSKGAGGTSSSSATPLTPSSDFVSNHHPNLSGSPAPNSMTSVCTTTSGATCSISFSKDGVVKTLGAQTTDRGGSTYWAWKLQDLGLTAGNWKVQATATLNGQSETATDALTLDVAP